MKKQIITTLALSMMILGSVSLANANQMRNYQELTLAQQQTYNKLTEQEKQNTKPIFGFYVHKSQATPYTVSDDNSTAKRDGIRKWNNKQFPNIFNMKLQ